jgi:inhibitor of cysteine peptidase
MMLKRAALLSLISIIVCGFGPICKDPVKLTEADSGKTIEMKIGDCLNIVLGGNPTTGYIWEEASRISPVLKQYKRMVFAPQSKLIGSGGKCTFHYKAAARGTKELKLVYHRSWEKKVPPLKVFDVKVKVKL